MRHVVFTLGDERYFFLTSASKFDIELNGGIFDVSPENDGASPNVKTHSCGARKTEVFHTGRSTSDCLTPAPKFEWVSVKLTWHPMQNVNKWSFPAVASKF